MQPAGCLAGDVGNSRAGGHGSALGFSGTKETLPHKLNVMVKYSHTLSEEKAQYLHPQSILPFRYTETNKCLVQRFASTCNLIISRDIFCYKINCKTIAIFYCFVLKI